MAGGLFLFYPPFFFYLPPLPSPLTCGVFSSSLQAPPLPLRGSLSRCRGAGSPPAPPVSLLGGLTCQNNNNHKGGRGAFSLHPPHRGPRAGITDQPAVPGVGTAGLSPERGSGEGKGRPAPILSGAASGGPGGKGRGSCAGAEGPAGGRTHPGGPGAAPPAPCSPPRSIDLFLEKRGAFL